MLHNYTWQYTIIHFDKNLVNETNDIFTIYYISSPKCYTTIVTKLLHLLKHMHWKLIHILPKMQLCAVLCAKPFLTKRPVVMKHHGFTYCIFASIWYFKAREACFLYMYCIFATKETEASIWYFKDREACFLIT